MGRYYRWITSLQVKTPKKLFSPMELQYIITGGIIGIIIGFLIAKIIYLNQRKSLQKDAIRGSRNSLTGEIYEKVLPALPGFPYAPKDMVFVGKGCDYIIFDWLASGHLREIVFLELKSGNATLNANEKMIRDIIERKKVRYSEYRINSTKDKD